MGSFMRYFITSVSEGFVAIAAVIWSLCCVKPLMGVPVGGVRKSLLTILTLERLHFGMDPFMLDSMVIHSEVFAAEGAFVRS